MIKDIIHDPILLAQKSKPATEEDIPIADNLIDTLRANSGRCVGMAANMIGETKRIIVFDDNGKIAEMFNPEIISGKEQFEAEEGCLSLTGTRKTKRYKAIKVKWQNRQFQYRIKNFTGLTAQIIQHEIDHCNGILI
ncbi:MAG: peptide deformylase [Clostridia bacterium]|nr:peptide deformylase [Clostridia bacterium]